MSSALSSFSSRLSAIPYILPVILSIVVAATGCGSSTSSPGGPKFRGNTSANLLLSSAANDQLSRFDIQLQSLKLTDQSGTVIDLISADQGIEFIHVNGGIEPLLTVSIPQGIYTSATASIGAAMFTCVTLKTADW